MQLKIHGRASKSIIKEVTLIETSLEENLMSFLLKRGVPIASSCMGENICKKCVINDGFLSCSISVKDYINKYGYNIFVDYL